MAKAKKPIKPEQDKSGRFVPGNNGGSGRPRGSRNKLGEAFVDDLYADWKVNGVATLARVREERPQDYVKVVASILPKNVNVNVRPLEEMTDAQLRKQAEQLMRELGPLAAFAAGGDLAGSSEEEARKPLN